MFKILIFFTVLVCVNKETNAQEIILVENDERLNKYCLATLQNALSYSLKK
jgi:hypothetical protein